MQGSIIIGKHNIFAIWISRSSHSLVLKNLLNGGELYERRIFLEFEKIFRTASEYSRSKILAFMKFFIFQFIL